MSHINISTINERIGGGGAVKLTGDYIVNDLGIKPAMQEKRSMLWSESQFPEIILAHIERLQAVGRGQYYEAATRPEKKGKKVIADPFGDEAPAAVAIESDPFGDVEADPFA